MGEGGLTPATRYVLPGALRGALAGDFGPVVQTETLLAHIQGAPCIAAVGDVVSLTLHRLGVAPRLFVCDYKTQRGDESREYRRVLGTWGDREIHVSNPPATVTREAWLAIREAYSQEGTTRIVVDGEEDLLGIPAFLEAPLGAKVLYGSPGKGVVVVTVDAAFKERVAGILERFQRE